MHLENATGELVGLASLRLAEDPQAPAAMAQTTTASLRTRATRMLLSGVADYK
jgi:hypothetical protein